MWGDGMDEEADCARNVERQRGGFDDVGMGDGRWRGIHGWCRYGRGTCKYEFFVWRYVCMYNTYDAVGEF